MKKSDNSLATDDKDEAETFGQRYPRVFRPNNLINLSIENKTYGPLSILLSTVRPPKSFSQ